MENNEENVVQESISQTETELIRFKRSSLYTMLLPVAFVTGLATGFLFWGRNPKPTVSANPPANPPDDSTTQVLPRLEVSTDDDPSLGPEDAPVVMIEFSDFNCPYCRKFHQETFSVLMKKYEGQIHFVYRDFPVVGGGQVGTLAAQAANCAAEQGDYWAYHDALFSGKYNLDQTGFQNYAVELGLDEAALSECLASGRYQAEVESDLRYGADLGVTGTPTFFINGIPLVGAQPLSNFAQVVDAELTR
jgi:protein-disulfide isomerase